MFFGLCGGSTFFVPLLLEVSLEALAVVEFLKRYELCVDVEGGLGALLAANDPNAGLKSKRNNYNRYI